MIRLLATACIDAPPRTVWKQLADLETISRWAPSIRRARCAGALSHGIGAEQTCELVGGLTITERWTAWDEGRSFTYEGSGLPLVKRAMNTWSVRPDADRSLLVSEPLVELRGGALGRMLEPLFAAVFRRMAPRSLAAFKYLVEHGKPSSGRPSRLPRAPVAC
jgi:polyketide cyclase/dehydrase/lipid transport protein